MKEEVKTHSHTLKISFYFYFLNQKSQQIRIQLLSGHFTALGCWFLLVMLLYCQLCLAQSLTSADGSRSHLIFVLLVH